MPKYYLVRNNPLHKVRLPGEIFLELRTIYEKVDTVIKNHRPSLEEGIAIQEKINDFFKKVEVKTGLKDSFPQRCVAITRITASYNKLAKNYKNVKDKNWLENQEKIRNTAVEIFKKLIINDIDMKLVSEILRFLIITDVPVIDNKFKARVVAEVKRNLTLQFQLPSMEESCISSILWSISKITCEDEDWKRLCEENELKQSFLDLIEKKYNQFDARDTASILYALAKMRVQWNTLSATLRQVLSNAVNKNLYRFNEQEIANIVWAFATMGMQWHEVQQLFPRLCSVIKSHQLTAQGTANTLWALAKMGVQWNKLPETFRQTLSNAVNNLYRFNEQEIANTVWAFATMGAQWHEVHQLFLRLFNEIELYRFTAQGTANILLALAKMGVQWNRLSVKLQEALLNAVNRNLYSNQFNAKEIVNTLWAFATMGAQWGEIYQLLLALLSDNNLHQFNAQQIANTMWVLATIGAQYSEIHQLFPALLNAIDNNLDLFNEQEMANTVWAFAKIKVPWNIFSKTFQNKLLSTINNKSDQSNSDQFNGQGMSNSLFALMHLDMDNDDQENICLKEFMRKQLKHLSEKQIAEIKHTDKESTQLKWVILYCYEKDELSSEECTILNSIIQQVIPIPKSSKYHQCIEEELISKLKKFKEFKDIKVIRGFSIYRSVFINITVKKKGKNEPLFFIEVDGPDHDDQSNKLKDYLCKKLMKNVPLHRIKYKDVGDDPLKQAQALQDIISKYSTHLTSTTTPPITSTTVSTVSPHFNRVAKTIANKSKEKKPSFFTSPSSSDEKPVEGVIQSSEKDQASFNDSIFQLPLFPACALFM